MIVLNRLLASVAVVTACLMPSVASYAAGAILYVPSASAGCASYDKIEVAQNSTVTISCAASVGAIFTITAINASPPVNTSVAFQVKRIVPTTGTVGNDALPLTISQGTGAFTDTSGTILSTTTPTSTSVAFTSTDGPDATKTVYAKFTALGTAAVSSGSLSAVVNVVSALVCTAPPPTYTEDLGELKLLAGSNTIGFFDVLTTSATSQPVRSFKFRLSATEPRKFFYGFSFGDSPYYPNGLKDLSISDESCPGQFDSTKLGANCYLQPPTAINGIAIGTESLTGAVTCMVHTGKTYYLNVRQRVPGTNLGFLFTISE